MLYTEITSVYTEFREGTKVIPRFRQWLSNRPLTSPLAYIYHEGYIIFSNWRRRR